MYGDGSYHYIEWLELTRQLTDRNSLTSNPLHYLADKFEVPFLADSQRFFAAEGQVRIRIISS